MSWLVDANVLSEPTRPRPDPQVVDWLRRHEAAIRVDSVILGELRYGILLLPSGARRKRLLDWFDGGVRRIRCLDWDAEVGLRWAKLLCGRSEGNFVGVKVFGSTERGIEALPGADLVLTSSEVFGNAGGGVAGYGDGLLLLYGTWIYGNYAFAGGGLFVGDGREVYGGVVESNTADRGAGVYAMGSRLVGTQILGNGHAVQGGGIYGDHAVTLGAELVLESVTVTGNLADLGGGMYLEAYTRPP